MEALDLLSPGFLIRSSFNHRRIRRTFSNRANPTQIIATLNWFCSKGSQATIIFKKSLKMGFPHFGNAALPNPNSSKSKRCLSRPNYALFCNIEKILRLHRWTSINNQHPTNFIKILGGVLKYDRLVLFKIIFIWKCFKIIFFYFLKFIFDITYQNNPKTLKK